MTILAPVENQFASLNDESFSAWAEVYDEQDNPLLSLEERFLKRMLPEVGGRHILDAGCGTGRWLELLSQLGQPASLLGVDASLSMLQKAESKAIASARLVRSQLPSIPLREESVDLALSSFVLSYVDDLEGLAAEMFRVMRDHGDLFFSDMHPRTATELGWKRGFRRGGRAHDLQTTSWTIDQLVEVMTRHGFRLMASCEPCFGRAEQVLFERGNRSDAWVSAIGSPAIFVLHFRKGANASSLQNEEAGMLCLSGASCVLGADEVIEANIFLRNDRIEQIASHTSSSVSTLNLEGYRLFPGLVNAHDHLEFALFPRLGVPPYRNATEWALDIQERFAECIVEQKRIPRDIRLLWGGLRNLLCGVTTVCHHNPINPILRQDDFPVRVVTEFGWEHSIAFADDLADALQKRGEEEPFVIHACEGIDAVAESEFKQLLQMDALDERTVLVHGLAMNDAERLELNRRGAGLIACPSSNQFLFHQTLSAEQLQLIERIAFGSDSSLTAAGDLLDELRFAKEMLGASTEMLYASATTASSDLLRLKKGEGHIQVDGVADFFAFRSVEISPAEQLTSLSWRDVELVVVKGTVRLASAAMWELLPDRERQGLHRLTIDGLIRWIAAPVAEMLEAAGEVLGLSEVRLNGRRIAMGEV